MVSIFVVCQPLTFANHQYGGLGHMWRTNDQDDPLSLKDFVPSFQEFAMLTFLPIDISLRRQSALCNPGDWKYCEVDHPPVVLPRELLRTLPRHELDHSRPRLLVNLRQRWWCAKVPSNAKFGWHCAFNMVILWPSWHHSCLNAKILLWDCALTQ